MNDNDRLYRIRTYDVEKQDYTPQEGVPEIVKGIAGLRAALRALQSMGYPCDRAQDSGDPSVLVERIDPKAV